MTSIQPPPNKIVVKIYFKKVLNAFEKEGLILDSASGYSFVRPNMHAKAPLIDRCTASEVTNLQQISKVMILISINVG